MDVRRGFVTVIISAAGIMAAASEPSRSPVAVDAGRPHSAVILAQARDYIDRGTPSGIEGIWEFPDDETQVFIKRADGKGYRYDITVVSTPDCRLHAGDRLGTVEASADASRFRISLFSNRSGDALTDMRECLGIFDDRKGTLSIEPVKYKINLRLGILPRFWRMLRVKRTNPLERLPYGMIRVYPSYDGNGSSLRQPRYL